MCKPQKKGKGMNADKEVGHVGFGKIRKLIHATEDMRNYQPMWPNGKATVL